MATQVTEEPRAFSIAEIARQMGLSEWLVKKEIYSGRLVARRFGTRIFVMADDYDRFIKSLPPIKGVLGTRARRRAGITR